MEQLNAYVLQMGLNVCFSCISFNLVASTAESQVIRTSVMKEVCGLFENQPMLDVVGVFTRYIAFSHYKSFGIPRPLSDYLTIRFSKMISLYYNNIFVIYAKAKLQILNNYNKDMTSCE